MPYYEHYQQDFVANFCRQYKPWYHGQGDYVVLAQHYNREGSRLDYVYTAHTADMMNTSKTMHVIPAIVGDTKHLKCYTGDVIYLKQTMLTDIHLNHEVILDMEAVPGVISLQDSSPRLIRKGGNVLCTKAIVTAQTSSALEETIFKPHAAYWETCNVYAFFKRVEKPPTDVDSKKRPARIICLLPDASSKEILLYPNGYNQLLLEELAKIENQVLNFLGLSVIQPSNGADPYLSVGGFTICCCPDDGMREHYAQVTQWQQEKAMMNNSLSEIQDYSAVAKTSISTAGLSADRLAATYTTMSCEICGGLKGDANYICTYDNCDGTLIMGIKIPLIVSQSLGNHPQRVFITKAGLLTTLLKIEAPQNLDEACLRQTLALCDRKEFSGFFTCRGAALCDFVGNITDIAP